MLCRHKQLRTLVNLSKPSITDNFGNMTLLVIAHPDDETMFFGPTILKLIENKKHLIILCMSNGNADNMGDHRRQEFFDVIEALGPYVTSNMIEDMHLKDGLGVDWNPQIVGMHIERYVRSRNFPIQSIVTFDPRGVSGHPNHKSIYKATTTYLKRNLKDLNISYFFLNTVDIWRKYISFLDAPITLVKYLFLSDGEEHNVIAAIDLTETSSLRRILSLHKSQMVWFRQLYMFFSRYMLINDLSSY